MFGVVLGAVLFAGLFGVPRAFRANVDRNEAERAAAQAVRELQNTNFALLALAPSAEALRDADLDALLANPELWQESDPNDPTVRIDARERIVAQAAELAGRVRTLDRKLEDRGITPSTPPELRLDSSGGLRSAITALDTAIKRNREVWQGAAASAKRAEQAMNNVAVAAYARGAVELADAGLRLAEAQAARSDMELALGDLLQAAQDLCSAQIEADQLKVFDVAPVLSGLQADLEETAKAQKAADELVAQLQAQHQQAGSELAAVREKLRQRQAERMALEEKSFTPGDQASFDEYRRQYQALSTGGQDSLVELQRREQLLSSGGFPDAHIEDDNFESGAVTGGEPLVGVETLARRLEGAREVAARWELGRKAIEEQIARVKQRNDGIQQDLARYAARVRELREALDKRRERAAAAYQAAFDKEGAAITAAQAAAQAFARVGTAVGAWKSAARELRSQSDSSNKNDRLAMILRDSAAENIGPSAEAEALMTAGRAFALRVAGITTYLTAMERVRELAPDFSFDAAATQTELTTAQTTATTELERAVSTLTRLADANAPTSWIHQALLAYMYHILGHINPDKEQLYFAQAAQRIAQAVRGKERSPYLAEHVVFLEHLGAGAPGQNGSGETTPPADADDAAPPAGNGG